MAYTQGQAARDEVRDRIADLRVEPSPPWAAGQWETYQATSIERIRVLLARRHSQERADYLAP